MEFVILTQLELDDDGRDVVALYVNYEFVSDDYVSIGNATCDTENINAVSNRLIKQWAELL